MVFRCDTSEGRTTMRLFTYLLNEYSAETETEFCVVRPMHGAVSGACPTVERSTILIHVCGSLHCWTTQRRWSDPRFVDRFLDSIHAAEIT